MPIPSRKRTPPAAARGNRRGVAAVEFAVVAPLMVMLILGVIEYAQLVDTSHTVCNASRRGARLAARHSTATTVDVENYVRDYLTSMYPQLGASSPSVGVVVKDGAGAAVSGTSIGSIDRGDQCSVDVSLSFDAVRWLGFFTTLSNTTLQSSTYIRRQ